MTPRTTLTHRDEIDGLLASGYVRLRQKRTSPNTSGPQSLDERAGSLDSGCQAERSWAGHESLQKEKVHGDHV